MITSAEINLRNREYYGQESGVPTPTPYERRFAAYIDIIGWKDACCDPSRHAAVFAVAKTLSGLPKNFSQDLKDKLSQTKGVTPDLSHAKAEVVTFSDNLAISMPVDVGYTHFFRFLTFVCRDLLTKGFLTRGGVTVGNLCHKENMIFGPALICAVALEQEAIYPRLMCSRNLVEDIEHSPNVEPSNPKLIITDHLGRSAVNLLAFAHRCNPAAWNDLEKQITDAIDVGGLTDKHLEKWRYMRDVLQIMIQGTSER